MGWCAMIAISAVFLEHLPVCLGAIFLRTAQTLHAGRALAGHVAEITRRASKIFDQRLSISIEAYKNESFELLEPFDATQIQRTIIVRVRRQSLRAGHADQIAAVIENPAVIRACKRFLAAGRFPAHHHAAMRARIVEGVQFSFLVARQKKRTSGDLTRKEAVWFCDFR